MARVTAPLRCPRCGGPRPLARPCPRCFPTADSAEAETVSPAAEPAVLPSKPGFWARSATWDLPQREVALELRLRIFALPVAIALAWWAAHGAGLAHTLMRTFFSMWVHELGHAVSAWLSGLPAFPGPWFTPVAGARSWPFALVLASALGYGAYHYWRRRRWVLAIPCGLLLLTQAFLTLGLSLPRANELMIFNGDGGGLVLGTLLMASFYAPPGHHFHRTWLRWGFLVIGAAAFCDAYATWWSAHLDTDQIPFGENEGSGPSDPSRLVDQYGWAVSQMVNRYLFVGALCLAVLSALYVLGLRKSGLERQGPEDGL